MSASTLDYRPLHMPWWIPLIQGIAAVILGILLWTNPVQTATTIVMFLAIYWIVTGVLALISLIIDRTHWGWKVFNAVIGILAGWALLSLGNVEATVLFGWTVVILLAIQGIVLGVVELIEAFQGGGWGPGIMGVLSIVFGILLWTHSLAATVILPWVIAIFMIAGGIAAIIVALRLRSATA